MATSSCGDRAWIVELEKTVDKADVAVEMSRWRDHFIYRVPESSIKDRNPKAYRSQVVSLGPFYHGDNQLLPMEEHKRRAVGHFLRRAKKPLVSFAAAVEEVMDKLQGAYADLDLDRDEKWRGAEGRERFLEMLIVDGCFVLEVMRVASFFALWAYPEGYAPNDLIFSRHGMLYKVPDIRRDMLILENQLPLLLLAKLFAVERDQAFFDKDAAIKREVLMFLSAPTSVLPPASDIGLPLHPLNLYRQSMVYDPVGKSYDPELLKKDVTIPSAVELYEAGIQFKKSGTESPRNIRFWHGELSIPPVAVDDSTEYVLLNIMAFEMLHLGAGNGVTAYVYFMNEVIRSDKDVALLSSKGIIQNAIGSEQAVVNMFHSISKDVVLEQGSAIGHVLLQVNAYCSKPWNMWRANVITDIIAKYFRSPTSFINFIAASIILIMTIIQTIYTIVSFNKGQDQKQHDIV